MGEQNAMTVKELREKLEMYPDNFLIMIPESCYGLRSYTNATNVTKSANESFDYIFINDV